MHTQKEQAQETHTHTHTSNFLTLLQLTVSLLTLAEDN